MRNQIKVFASHDWGEHASNHVRVREIVQLLRQSGLDVWFAESHMRGNIIDAMCEGIDESDLVLCFITRNYLDKVASGDKCSRDNCRREFMCACTPP